TKIPLSAFCLRVFFRLKSAAEFSHHCCRCHFRCCFRFRYCCHFHCYCRCLHFLHHRSERKHRWLRLHHLRCHHLLEEFHRRPVEFHHHHYHFHCHYRFRCHFL